MKTKSFQEYLEKRLDKDEIEEIRQQAQSEIRIFKSLVGTHGKFPSFLWKGSSWGEWDHLNKKIG